VAVKAFEVDFGAKYPKAVAKIVNDLDTLLEFYKYPAEHWIHLRPTNPIESINARYRRAIRARSRPAVCSCSDAPRSFFRPPTQQLCR
jgi:putative transposase